MAKSKKLFNFWLTPEIKTYEITLRGNQKVFYKTWRRPTEALNTYSKLFPIAHSIKLKKI